MTSQKGPTTPQPEVSWNLNLDVVDVGAAQELVQDPVTMVGIARVARAAQAEAERQSASETFARLPKDVEMKLVNYEKDVGPKLFGAREGSPSMPRQRAFRNCDEMQADRTGLEELRRVVEWSTSTRSP